MLLPPFWFWRHFISEKKIKTYTKFITFLFLFILGCNQAPEAVFFGFDHCDFCAMGISDHRYGGVILTKKGKTYKFDSLECLLSFEQKKLNKSEVVQTHYAFNTFKKGENIELDRAIFLNVPKFRSPMGIGIWATDSKEQISRAQIESGGEVLNWKQLKIILQKD